MVAAARGKKQSTRVRMEKGRFVCEKMITTKLSRGVKDDTLRGGETEGTVTCKSTSQFIAAIANCPSARSLKQQGKDKIKIGRLRAH